MEKPLPYFSLYVGDFLSDTSGLDNASIGAYMKLLCHQWINGSLPTDPEKLARIAVENSEDFTLKWQDLSSKFTETDGKLYNLRLKELRKDTVKKVAEWAKSGKAGADARWNGKRHGNRYGNRHGERDGILNPNTNIKLNIKKQSQTTHDDYSSHGVDDNPLLPISNQTASEVVEQWNRYAEKQGIPRIKGLSAGRRTKLAERMTEKEFDLSRIIETLKEADFATGAMTSGWKATFDWVIENDTNYLKILEGNFDL
jgi:uncharacterized protein YdaU (DUF1376 family)